MLELHWVDMKNGVLISIHTIQYIQWVFSLSSKIAIAFGLQHGQATCCDKKHASSFFARLFLSRPSRPSRPLKTSAWNRLSKLLRTSEPVAPESGFRRMKCQEKQPATHLCDAIWMHRFPAHHFRCASNLVPPTVETTRWKQLGGPGRNLLEK